MPRYFLDFTDTGELLRDDEGMELVDLEAARMEALASLGEIAKDQLRDGDRRDFIIDIRERLTTPLSCKTGGPVPGAMGGRLRWRMQPCGRR
jgi:hypothetical protein